MVIILIKIIFTRKGSFHILETRQRWHVLASGETECISFSALPVFRSLYRVLCYHHGGLHPVLLNPYSDGRTQGPAAAQQRRPGQRSTKAGGERRRHPSRNCAVLQRRNCGGQHQLKKWQHFKTEPSFLIAKFPSNINPENCPTAKAHVILCWV